MNSFTGTYDFAVEIPEDAINTAIASTFPSQLFLPTVFLRGKGVFPDKDLYLNTPSIAFQPDSSVLLSLPFVTHQSVGQPNVHGTAQIQATFVMQDNSLVLNLNPNSNIVDFDGPGEDPSGYELLLSIVLANHSTFPLFTNLPLQFGFWAQPGVLRIFLSADGHLHTNPTPPPVNPSLYSGNGFTVLIDSEFVQQELATQLTKMYGSFPISVSTQAPDLTSVTLFFNQTDLTAQAVATLAVGIVPIPSVTISQDLELGMDGNDPQAGVLITPLGEPQISAGYSDLLQLFLPFVGTALLELIQQIILQSISQALGTQSLGGQFLERSIFGIAASVDSISNSQDRITLGGEITPAPKSTDQYEWGGINPKLPRFVNNTRTWVYHFLPCFYGSQISGDFWTLSEASAQSLAAYAADTQHPWDACYVCLPQYHKLRPGQLTSFYKIPSAIGSGPITGNYRLQGTLVKQTQAGEFGDSSFDHTYQVEPTLPDGYGNVIVHNVTPTLAPGDWQIVATSTNDPAWQVEVTGFVDFWTPLAIYLTFSSPKTDPHQTPPYDPAVPSGIPGQYN